MALIKCPDCGKEVSDKAEVCINCGRPLKETKNPSVEKSILNKDAIIAQRLNAHFSGPIFGLIVVGLTSLGLLIATIVFFSKNSIFLAILFLISLLAFSSLFIPCIFAIVNRTKNNLVKQPGIVYKADIDSFEMCSFDGKTFLIERNSIRKASFSAVTVIYYVDENGQGKQRTVAYLKVDDLTKKTFYKYLVFNFI